MNEVNDDRILELLGKKLSGNISLPERLELAEWMKKYPDKAHLGKMLEELFMHKRSFDKNQLPASSSSRVFNSVLHQISSDKPRAAQRKNSYLYRIGVAAAAVLILALFFIFEFNNRSRTGLSHPITASTKKGGKSNLILPDGTKVWLNNDTKISYDESFGRKNRNVQLVGEAYFEVTHDAEHPFLVHTQQADIKVLGTVFNVRSYPDESVFETSLVTGKVEITIKNKNGKKIELVPNEKLTIVNNNEDSVITSASTPSRDAHFSLMQVQPLSVQNNTVIETSWINDQLAFYNKPLEDIAKDLERAFNIRVSFRNSDVKKYRFTGIYDNSDLRKIMEIMTLSNPFQYHFNGDELIIE